MHTGYKLLRLIDYLFNWFSNDNSFLPRSIYTCILLVHICVPSFGGPIKCGFDKIPAEVEKLLTETQDISQLFDGFLEIAPAELKTRILKNKLYWEKRARSKGANKNLMSLMHEALATFVIMKYHSSEPSLISTLFENGQKKYFNVLATTTPGDLEIQLETVRSYFNFLSLLAKSNIAEDPQMLQIYSELAVNPILAPTLVAIGRMEKATSFNNKFRVEETLIRLAPIIAKLPVQIVAELLNRFVQDFSNKERIMLKGVTRPTAVVLWQKKDINEIIAHFATEGQGEFLKQLQTEFSSLPAAERKIATEPGIVNSVYFSDYTETRKMLLRLVKNDQFKKLEKENRAILFYYLSKSIGLANETSDTVLAKLYWNTVEAVVSGHAKIAIERLDKDTLGDASSRTNEIRLNRLHTINNKGISLGDDAYDGVNTLAHEVSHIKSRQGVAADVNYFEEEMRAWLVGTYAGTRKLPNKLQAANRAYFLLGFKSDTGLEAYDFISRGWNDHPETFKRHLKELGLGKLTPQSSADEIDKIFDAIKHDDPAPLWGWDGFLMNEPRPTSKTH